MYYRDGEAQYSYAVRVRVQPDPIDSRPVGPVRLMRAACLANAGINWHWKYRTAHCCPPHKLEWPAEPKWARASARARVLEPRERDGI